jgi:hypothetical protein
MERRNDMARFEKDVFAKVTKTEQTALDSVRKWAKSMGDLAPVEMPILEQLVKEVFDFTEEVLRLQRELVHKALTATLAPPQGGRAAPRASKAPAHRTTKPHATRAA